MGIAQSRLIPLTRWQLIVGVLFLGVGLMFTFGMVARSLYGYWRTRAEVTAPARIQSVEIRTSNTRNGSTRYTEAKYEYQVGGATYSGSQIAIFKQSHPYFRSLDQARRTGKPVPVYIDPDRPWYAVIDRAFSWWPFWAAVLFSIAFTTAGSFMLWRVWQPWGAALRNRFSPHRKLDL